MSKMKTVFDALQSATSGITVAELSKQTGLTIMQVSHALSKLHAYGKAHRNSGYTRHVGRTYWPVRKRASAAVSHNPDICAD